VISPFADRPKVFSCDHHEIPLPAGHKFPIAKYRMLRESLERAGTYEVERAPLADAALIELAHSAEYVRCFLTGSLDARIVRRIGFPWSEGLVHRTLCSVGATLAATQQALRTGFGGALAGGTHHAFHAEGSGFCVFNDIAIAARHTGMRTAVVDLDVHQGDGTAALLAGDEGVLTVSLHGENNFPLRKQRSGIDIGFADGTGDEEYLLALNGVLSQVRKFQPELVFYQSGVDALATDRLGRLDLTLAGLRKRDELVFTMVRELGVPVVVTLGGGYSEPIERSVEAHAGTYEVAAQVLVARGPKPIGPRIAP
jgi:acetoin utilization deacetylase AcuC-like enzyme